MNRRTFFAMLGAVVAAPVAVFREKRTVGIDYGIGDSISVARIVEVDRALGIVTLSDCHSAREYLLLREAQEEYERFAAGARARRDARVDRLERYFAGGQWK